jgi:hypothetical protein
MRLVILGLSVVAARATASLTPGGMRLLSRHYSRASLLQKISTSSSGELGTLAFRQRYREDGREISPWHDIPLRNGNDFNFITEVCPFPSGWLIHTLRFLASAERSSRSPPRKRATRWLKTPKITSRESTRGPFIGIMVACLRPGRTPTSAIRIFMSMGTSKFDS